MKIIDLHTDTLTAIKNDENIVENNRLHIDLKRAHESGYSLWTIACFLNMPQHGGTLFQDACSYFQKLDKAIEADSNIAAPFTSYDEYIKNKESGKVTIFKSIEEGEIIEGKLDNLRRLYNKGVKMMTLTWNYPNSLAWPNYPRENLNQAETNFGLTETGKKVCLELNRLGMLLDVFHLGDKSFYDAIEFYKGPIIASHSNARAINPSVRNLTDDMIRIISKSGGVIGLNLCENFVTKTGDYLNDLVLHLNHIKAVGGIDVVSLGSDFDGIQTPPLITDCTKWNILFDRLSKEGWTDEEIEKLSCKNFERVLKMFK